MLPEWQHLRNESRPLVADGKRGRRRREGVSAARATVAWRRPPTALCSPPGSCPRSSTGRPPSAARASGRSRASSATGGRAPRHLLDEEPAGAALRDPGDVGRPVRHRPAHVARAGLPWVDGAPELAQVAHDADPVSLPRSGPGSTRPASDPEAFVTLYSAASAGAAANGARPRSTR